MPKPLIWLDEAWTAESAPPPAPRAVVTPDLADQAAALVTDWRNSSGAHVTPSQSGVLRAMVAAALADAQVAGCAPTADTETTPDDAARLAAQHWGEQQESMHNIAARLADFMAGYRTAAPSADTETLRRVRRLIEDHEIRDTENGALFADRLDDVLRAALDGGR